MTPEQFRGTLQGLADAWSKKDYERAASHFAPDVKYGDPTRYLFANRDELLAFFRNDEGYDQLTEWHHVLFDEKAQIGAVEYTYQGTYRYHGVVLIKLAGDKITHWREYQHISPKGWREFVGATWF
ncbi:MAG TPA: nuclear transport factor 2 family protein [Terriglobales bacterium]|nr:nuclear transport factor 2 family protein [Terriglobales bacterium]